MATIDKRPGSTMATVDRLQLTLNHIQPEPLPPKITPSIVHGPAESPLWEMTLAELLEYQSQRHMHDECMVVPWTGTRWTYGQLHAESQKVARGLIAQGVRLGDRIGIMAGNCEQYISVFFAAASVGAILVVINNNYTLTELTYALRHTGMPAIRSLHATDSNFILHIGCKLLVCAPRIGRRSLHDILEYLHSQASRELPQLERVVLVRDEYKDFKTYNQLVLDGSSVPLSLVSRRSNLVNHHDVCNLQFTSGSTGNPKASMLTHQYVYNPCFDEG